LRRSCRWRVGPIIGWSRPVCKAEKTEARWMIPRTPAGYCFTSKLDMSEPHLACTPCTDCRFCGQTVAGNQPTGSSASCSISDLLCRPSRRGGSTGAQEAEEAPVPPRGGAQLESRVKADNCFARDRNNSLGKQRVRRCAKIPLRRAAALAMNNPNHAMNWPSRVETRLSTGWRQALALLMLGYQKANQPRAATQSSSHPE